MLLDLSSLFHSSLPLLFHGACSVKEGVVVAVVIVLVFPVFLLALTGDWKPTRPDKSSASPSGVLRPCAFLHQEDPPRTGFLAQQSSGFQHPTSFQAALDGCFFLLACVSDLGDQLPSQGIVHGESGRSSSVERMTGAGSAGTSPTVSLGSLTLSCTASCHDLCPHTQTPVPLLR